MKDYFERLRKERVARGLTYQDMAEKLGISKCYYWQLEHKQRRLYYDLAVKIARILDLKPDDIFYEEI